MNILFILDPLEKLTLTWDSSIYFLRVLVERGHTCWICGPHDIFSESNEYFVQAKLAKPKDMSRGAWDPENSYELLTESPQRKNVTFFNVILNRKEPPFDDTYLYMTHILEQIHNLTPVQNHPAGIRNTNEKLSILKFPKWIPNTIVSSSVEEISSFQDQLNQDLVIKPLDLKGGKGIFRLELSRKETRTQELTKATENGSKVVMAQEFLQSTGTPHDKRVLLFNGKIWAAYERKAAPGDFRANVTGGGSFHPTILSETEKNLCHDLFPYLKSEEILLTGIDILNEKLIEINVTCSAGLCETKNLYPDLDLAGEWATYLESL